MPTTIFDSSLITQRNRDKAIAQNVKQRNTEGLPIITPQTGYGSYTISDVDNGQITNYKKVGPCTTVDLPCTCEQPISISVPIEEPCIDMTDINSLGPQDIFIYHTLSQGGGCAYDDNMVHFSIQGNVTINWGDGTTESFDNPENTLISHTYPPFTNRCVNYIIGITGTIEILQTELGTNITTGDHSGGCNEYEIYNTNIVINNGDNLLELIVNTPLISGIQLCTSLTTLDISGVLNFDVTQLVSLQNVITLFLSGINLSGTFDITGLSTQIEYLSFFANPNLNNITNIDLLTNLKGLEITLTNISDIDLSLNTALQLVTVSNTQISDTSTLFFNSLPLLTALTQLGVFGINITDINLSLNTLLEILDISYTNITDIDLSTNTLLETLDISETNINDLSSAFFNSLPSLTALTYLNVSDTTITDIDLSNNTLLETLNISETNISDSSSDFFTSLSSTTQLTGLFVSNTNLTQTGANDIATILVSYGDISAFLPVLNIIYQKNGVQIDVTTDSVWDTLRTNGWTIQ
jgi:Leucine-rich repeat (LRR) protein